MLTYASTFAGIGGFDLAFDRAGMAPTVQVEIDPKCLTVLDQHWPAVPKHEDITDVTGADIGRPDIICGGFPCQDTSIAAPHRKGLAGTRSSKYHEFRRLIEEHLRLADAAGARWVVIENTPGLLKTNGGQDFATVLRGLEELGYGWAYRVLDSRHLGTPQRRQRVIVVGHRGGDPGPAGQVLDLAEDSSGHPGQPDKGRRPGSGPQAVVRAETDGRLIFRKSRRPRSKDDYSTWPQAEFFNTLAGFDSGQRQTHLVVDQGRPRMLTLTEWERLQGFPDGWTSMVTRTARFQQLGNAMAVPMAEWLGRRLSDVHHATPMIGA